MNQIRLTVSVEPRLADYIRSAPDASALVARAVEEYRARELELEDAYREDAGDSARLNAAWGSSDIESPV